MSENYYRERAARRTRILIVVGLAAALVICGVTGVVLLLRDSCTGSFDRSPNAVVASFVEAVQSGNLRGAQECWQHDAYYTLDAGCSEICLSRAAGVRYDAVDITVGQPEVIGGRAALRAGVTVTCAGTGGTHTGEAVLDSVANEVPWRHWKIISSTVGGTTASQWCK